MEKKESRTIRVTFDEGRKSITLDKRAIRKAANKEAWVKSVLPATKNFGLPDAEIEKGLSDAFDSIREPEVKPTPKK